MFVQSMNLATEEGCAAELTGQVLSARYRVLQHIGEGALGSVYLVEHVHVGRRYALKLLRPEHRASQSIRQRFEQEARLGARLRSAYTVEVFDYDTWNGAPYLVMDYVEGSSLRALLEREGPLAAARAAGLILHACRGVADAHALGILHRDLKPSNLFVCGAPGGERCKVLDLGIAKQEPKAIASCPSTATGVILGTLAYMAPEQIRATRSLDARADVYALGAILYECLAGQPAFAAPTPPALMYKILEERPAPLAKLRPELPRELVALVERALAYDREARFPSARELERALAPFSHRLSQRALPASHDATDAGEAAPAPPDSARASSWREQRPPWSVAMTLALVAGGLGLAAGRLMQPAFAARVTTSQRGAVPAATGASTPAVSTAALSTDQVQEDQVQEPVHLSAALSPPVEPLEPPRSTALQHDVLPRRRSQSRPSQPGVRLTVAQGHELEGARSAVQTPAPEAPPLPLEAASRSASAPRVDLERANPYRQMQ
jgi:eukaryotic-like serine/threonine-protein kinase